MTLLRRLFLHDLGRKGLALGLAGLLWWQVNQTITVERTVTFVVSEGLAGNLGEPNTLRFVVPEGWVLSKPSPGETAQVTFRGPNIQLESFLATCSATFRLAPPDGDAPFLSSRFDAAAFDWTRPDEAEFFLGGVERIRREIPIEMERRGSEWLDLAPGMVPVTGDPAPGYAARPADLSFQQVTRIRLDGPQRTVTRIATEVEAAREGDGAMPQLFDEIDAGGARSDVVTGVGLRSAYTKNRLEIQPDAVQVRLPVRRTEPSVVEITLATTDVRLIGEPAGGRWEVTDFQRQFQVELHDEPGLALSFDQNWVATHLYFYVPLWSITSEAVDTQQVRLEWDFWGAADAAQEEQLKRALQVRPRAGAQDWTVELRKLDD